MFDERAYTPPCARGRHHIWTAPYVVVGGDPASPGRFNANGRENVAEVCPHCGIYRITRTAIGGAAIAKALEGDPVAPEVEYGEPDDSSLAWAAENAKSFYG